MQAEKITVDVLAWFLRGQKGIARVRKQNDGVEGDPVNRQRLDHYGNGGEGWDDEGWYHDYVSPLVDTTMKELDRWLGKGHRVSVDVDEKGFVNLYLPGR